MRPTRFARGFTLRLPLASLTESRFRSPNFFSALAGSLFAGYKVLPNILNEDQTCGVPGRSIFENLFLLRDTIDYARLKHLPAAVIGLDQEKAFDRVNHSFLQRVLAKFNFGPDFCSWVRVIYTDVSSLVINNGWLSSPFSLQRGARQGCALSPLLYCLVTRAYREFKYPALITNNVKCLSTLTTRHWS